MSGLAARLIVTRTRSRARDMLRSYWIEVDGERVGAVRRGESLVVNIPPGPHQVRAVIDWTNSGALDVDVAPGEQLGLVVKPGGNALQVWHTVIRVDRYLTLRRSAD